MLPIQAAVSPEQVDSKLKELLQWFESTSTLPEKIGKLMP